MTRRFKGFERRSLKRGVYGHLDILFIESGCLNASRRDQWECSLKAAVVDVEIEESGALILC